MSNEELALAQELLSAQSDEYALLTDETITDAQINELKALGIDKPPQVGWPRWMGPKDVKQRHEWIIHLAAMGKTNRQIAREVGMTDSRISLIINTPAVKQAIQLKIKEYFGEDAKAYIKTLAHKGFEVIEGILVDQTEKGTTRLDAAKYVVDHTIGKAQQTVTVQGSLLSELMIKLDSGARDVSTDLLVSELLPSTEIKPVAPPRDAMDNFVDSLDLEEVVIGKRSSGEE